MTTTAPAASHASGARRRPAEIRAALLLALLATAMVFLATTRVVIWDAQGFRRKVSRLFQVSLASPARGWKATFARQQARALSRRLLRGRQRGLFTGLPPGMREAPVPPALQPRPLPTGDQWRRRPPPAARFPAADPALPSHMREPVESYLPVLAVRKLGPPGGRPPPDLGRMYGSGRLGAGILGRPGGSVFKPKALPPPSRPLQEPAAPAPPPPAGVLAHDNIPAGALRLMATRPPQGYPSLDRDLEAVFTVYREPGAAEAYFRLRLKLKPRSRLKPMPKDVLFLVDISQSIPPAELKSVRAGVVRYLSHLRRADRFNVVLFSEKTYYLYPETSFAPAASMHAKTVEEFIRRHPGQRRTDVFGATRIILERVPRSDRPCNVFLLSDGKATQGVSDVRRLVHSFQRVNRANFSIFTFNAGPGGNLYLLRLLSYRSRGMLAGCEDLRRVPDALLRFCATVDAPVLGNVIATYTNIETRDVFPEVLPNLYRNRPITFWGRTRPGREVTMRVAGYTVDGPREFFFRALVPAGDATHPEIVREWARGQAHELMARLGDDPDNRALKDRVIALARRYRLREIEAMFSRKRLTDMLPWNRKSGNRRQPGRNDLDGPKDTQ